MAGKSTFGTDGVRGLVGKYPITVDFVMKLGWSIGKVIKKHDLRENVIIGRDTRISGDLIQSALEAGLIAAGCDVLSSGIMPTPSIAYLTRTFRCKIGIVISASHNPYFDNGIKFFSQDGYKISIALENEIQRVMEETIETAASQDLGKCHTISDAEGRYIEYCKGSIPHQASFKGLKLVVDCANGATFSIAPHVFNELGAEVIVLNNTPDGFNINEDCGSIHPEVIQRAVHFHKADVGIAFDGDGDRVIMVDHTGELFDGDDTLYIIAKSFIDKHIFCGGVVGTLMSNGGLQLALDDLGLAFVRVNVGDQNILQKLLEKKWILGGEPSGHIVFLKVNTTGDGIIAALQVLQAITSSGKPLHDLRKGLVKLPQITLNVPIEHEIELGNKKIKDGIKEAKRRLGLHGRVVIRASGTEPVIRIMIEGEDEITVNRVAHNFKDLLSTLTA